MTSFIFLEQILDAPCKSYVIFLTSVTSFCALNIWAYITLINFWKFSWIEYIECCDQCTIFCVSKGSDKPWKI